MKLKIKVTKEVLEATKMCGTQNWRLPDSTSDFANQNCAINYACRQLFPGCQTQMLDLEIGDFIIALPGIAIDFISRFDKLSPAQRVHMQAIQFEVELPDELIDSINITEARELLRNSTTLELI